MSRVKNLEENQLLPLAFRPQTQAKKVKIRSEAVIRQLRNIIVL